MVRKSTKVTYFGFTFDSQGEGQRALALIEWQNDGLISDLELDKDKLTIVLQPAFTVPVNDKVGYKRQHKMKAITYTPDYRYVYNGVTIHEDFKPRIPKTKKELARLSPTSRASRFKISIEPDSRIRIRLFHAMLANRENEIFRIVTIPSAPPNEANHIGYWYK